MPHPCIRLTRARALGCAEVPESEAYIKSERFRFGHFRLAHR